MNIVNSCQPASTAPVESSCEFVEKLLPGTIFQDHNDSHNVYLRLEGDGVVGLTSNYGLVVSDFSDGLNHYHVRAKARLVLE